MHHLFFQRRRLPAIGQPHPDESVDQDRRGQRWTLAGTARWNDSGHRDRPCTAHAGGESRSPIRESPSGLPAVENSLALMLDRVTAGDCSIHAGRVLDERRTGTGLGDGRKGTNRNRTTMPIWSWSTRSEARRFVMRNNRRNRKWSPWDGQTLTGWPVATWVARPTRMETSVDGFDESVRGSKPRFDHSPRRILEHARRNRHGLANYDGSRTTTIGPPNCEPQASRVPSESNRR